MKYLCVVSTNKIPIRKKNSILFQINCPYSNDFFPIKPLNPIYCTSIFDFEIGFFELINS